MLGDIAFPASFRLLFKDQYTVSAFTGVFAQHRLEGRLTNGPLILMCCYDLADTAAVVQLLYVRCLAWFVQHYYPFVFPEWTLIPRLSLPGL